MAVDKSNSQVAASAAANNSSLPLPVKKSSRSPSPNCNSSSGEEEEEDDSLSVASSAASTSSSSASSASSAAPTPPPRHSSLRRPATQELQLRRDSSQSSGHLPPLPPRPLPPRPLDSSQDSHANQFVPQTAAAAASTTTTGSAGAEQRLSFAAPPARPPPLQDDCSFASGGGANLPLTKAIQRQQEEELNRRRAKLIEQVQDAQEPRERQLPASETIANKRPSSATFVISNTPSSRHPICSCPLPAARQTAPPQGATCQTDRRQHLLHTTVQQNRTRMVSCSSFRRHRAALRSHR